MSLSEELAIWEGLRLHPGWKKLEEILKEQAGSRVNQITLSPLENSDAIYAQEFMKGEVAALQLIARLPEIQAQQLVADIKTEKERES